MVADHVTLVEARHGYGVERLPASRISCRANARTSLLPMVCIPSLRTNSALVLIETPRHDEADCLRHPAPTVMTRELAVGQA
jgi:hypothetical protein